MRMHLATALATALAVGVAGCSGGTQQGTKAGGSPAPVTLQIGSADGPGSPGGDMVVEFVRRVAELSGGQVVVEPVWHAAGVPAPPAWDQLIARRVVSGDLDLALVGSRAWDTEGVRSMEPINAPFLITSESVLDKVLTGDPLPRLMAGLDKIGVTGLTLLPEGMRHVFGWGRALSSPHDFDGVVIRAPHSDTVAAVFAALGARVDDPDGTAFSDSVADGTLAGAESSFALASGLPGRQPTTAGNVRWYPKVESLVANTKRFDALTDDQKSALRNAAAATQTWSIEQAKPDAEAAQQFCDSGGTVVLADPADVQALQDATRPVYDNLANDPEIGDLVRAIEQVRNSAPADPEPIACEPPTTSSPATVAGDGGDFPEGTYRIDISADELVAAGADAPWAGDVAGQWTLTFAHGGIDIVEVSARTGVQSTEHVSYCVTDGRLSYEVFGDESVCGDGVYFDAARHADGDRLRFLDVRAAGIEERYEAPALFGSKDWIKIG